VHVQNHLPFYDILDPEFCVENASSFLRDRETVTTDRNPISEWEVSTLMWCAQYEDAAAFYEKSIEVTKKFRMRSEGDYAHLGSALWCLGDYESAVKRWNEGVNAPYAC